MLPEVSDKISPKNQHLATHAWREKVKRRAVIDRAARKRKIVRDRSGVQNSAVVSRAPAVQALAASAFNYEAWKPWLRKVCEICELQAPEMLLLKDHITDHTQPPQRREKYSNAPWNWCVALPVFEDEIRRSPSAEAALQKERDRLRLIDTWREDLVAEWDDVKARAKRTNTKIHMGMVFQKSVEEEFETEKPENLREWKFGFSFEVMML
jgi:hypothetical protein